MCILNFCKMSFFRGHSLREIMRVFLSRYLATEWNKMHYLRLNTDMEVIEEKLIGFDLEVLPLTLDMVLAGDKTVFKGKKLELYKSRLQDPSYHGYGIMKEGRLIYSTWFSTDNLGLPIITKRIPLMPNEGLLEDSYCAPEARGQGLHGRMNYFRLKKLHELGKDRVLAIVLDGNTPAMKVQLKSGFEELGVFCLGRLLGIKFCTLKKERYDAK